MEKKKQPAENPNPEMQELSAKFDQLVEILSAEPDSKETPEGLHDIIQRMESLELRMASLQKECVRHLQRGTQALKRAEELREDEYNFDEDELPITAPISEPETVPEAPQNGAESDLDYIANQMRAQGQTPIL